MNNQHVQQFQTNSLMSEGHFIATFSDEWKTYEKCNDYEEMCIYVKTQTHYSNDLFIWLFVCYEKLAKECTIKINDFHLLLEYHLQVPTIKWNE